MHTFTYFSKYPRPKVLVLSGYYNPAYKAGGPVKTIEALVHHLGNDFEFLILALDHDFGENKPLTNIISGRWNKFEKASVFYASSAQITPLGIRRLLLTNDYDLLYINSFFSPAFSILPLILSKFRLINLRPVVLAPRGEFSPGAISLKSLKKRCYLLMARLLGLHRGIVWQASSQFEAENIRKLLPRIGVTSIRTCDIRIAPNLTKSNSLEFPERKDVKIVGILKIIFISRISPMKNLHYALEVLSQLDGNVIFDIYGPINTAKDSSYWFKCLRLIDRMSSSINVTYKGVVIPSQVLKTLSKYDLFFLPTRGENFGHAILESLAAGCPVLISDRTPWRDLQGKKAGWDLPLEQPCAFLEVLERLLEMNYDEYVHFSNGARSLALEVINNTEAIQQNRSLFLHALTPAYNL